MTDSVWFDVAENAVYFGLAPLLYTRLRRLDKLDSLPPPLLKKVRKSYQVASAMAAFNLRELKIALRALNQQTIPAILLKGSYLSEFVYEDHAERLMSDLDLMVPQHDLARATTALAGSGYYPSHDYVLEYETTVSHQLPPLFKSRHLPIELHWTILLPKLPYTIDVAGLWDRSVPLRMDEISVRGLSPEDLILHLAAHSIIQHKLTSGLRFIYDVALALRHFQEEIDWARLAELTRRWQVETPLYLTLCLSQMFFGSGAPEDFLRAIRPMEFEQNWIKIAIQLLLYYPKALPAFSRKMGSMLSMQSPAEKARLIFKRIFMSPQEMAEVYPVLPGSARLLFYYPVHFKDLIARHLPAMIGIARRDPTTLRSARLAGLLQEREDYLDKHLSA